MWLPTSIPWIPCFSDLGQQHNVAFQCANLTVPIDYLASSGNATTQIGMAMAHPIELGTPSGLLFYQGDSGYSNIFWDPDLDMLLDFTNRQSDIIIVDARGSGWSNALTCGLTEQSFDEYEDNMSATWDAMEGKELPFAFDTLKQMVDVYANQTLTPCNSGEDPDYLAHLNAPNIARDLDLIRNLTGFSMLDYYGWGYGSLIGVNYAALFPNQVGHMVLDAVIDFEAWMGVTGNVLDYSYQANSNTFDIFYQFAGYCVAAAKIDSKYCPLATASMTSADPINDIINRTNSILNTLSTVTSIHNSKTNITYDYKFVAREFYCLGDPGAWGYFANYLLDIEITIQAQHKRDTIPSTNISYPAFNTNVFAGVENPFIGYALPCIDNNFANIKNDTSFVNYLSEQIVQSGIITYQGIEFSVCLGWPNLTSQVVEKFTGPFPTSISNKILIVAESYAFGGSYNSIFNTYKFVGEQNAALLIHDAFGKTLNYDPNNCTLNAIKAYLTNGTLPQNGTVCQTDHTGLNNIFIHLYIENSTGSNSKIWLKVGLGLGLGVPVLGILIVFAGYWNVRRKGKTLDIPRLRPKYVPRNTLRNRQNIPEDRNGIEIQVFSDRSLFPESTDK